MRVCNKWTIEEENIVKQFYGKISTKDISKKVNRTITAVGLKARNLNLVGNHSIHKKIYSINEDYFKNINDERKAYYLGFIMADGNISDCDYTKLLRLNIHKKDIYILDNLQKDILSTYSIRYSKNNTVVIDYSSNKLCNDLIKLGCTPRKTFTLQFPEIREDLLPHFIRGYFDGDGSVGYCKGYLKVTFVGCEIFINALNQIFKNIGLNKSIYKYKTKNNYIYVILFQNKNDLNILFHWMYKDATIYLDRKYNRFKDYLKCL